jgi:hypothetical protein
MNKFIRKNKTALIAVAVVVVLLILFFALGSIDAGNDLRYIPV